MTVKSRLLISHLIMFIVPIFMTVIVAAVMPAGAPTLSRGNNYLYLENISIENGKGNETHEGKNKKPSVSVFSGGFYSAVSCGK